MVNKQNLKLWGSEVSEEHSSAVMNSLRAPPHIASRVRWYLNSKHTNKWIQRGELVSWLQCFTDLTLSIFFLQGQLTPKMSFTTEISSKKIGKTIIAECCGIRENPFKKLCDSTKLRLMFTRRLEGGHIKNLRNRLILYMLAPPSVI